MLLITPPLLFFLDLEIDPGVSNQSFANSMSFFANSQACVFSGFDSFRSAGLESPASYLENGLSSYSLSRKDGEFFPASPTSPANGKFFPFYFFLSSST